MHIASTVPFSIILALAAVFPLSVLAQDAMNDIGHAHVSYLQGRGQRHQRLATNFRANSTALPSEPSSSYQLQRQRRGGSRFTFYQTGLGACGKFNDPADFVVALNIAQWDGGAHCFETITISYNGKRTEAQITDQCASCPSGALDMSLGLFSFFTDPSQGMIFGDWHFGEDKQDEPTSSATTSTTTTSKPTPSRTVLPLSTLHHKTTTTSQSTEPTTSTENTPSPHALTTATAVPPIPSDSGARMGENLADFGAILADMGDLLRKAADSNSQIS